MDRMKLQLVKTLLQFTLRIGDVPSSSHDDSTLY